MSKTLCIIRKHAHACFMIVSLKQCIRAMSKQLTGFKWRIQRKAFTAVYIGCPLLFKIVTESFLENCQKRPFIPNTFLKPNKTSKYDGPIFLNHTEQLAGSAYQRFSRICLVIPLKLRQCMTKSYVTFLPVATRRITPRQTLNIVVSV